MSLWNVPLLSNPRVRAGMIAAATPGDPWHVTPIESTTWQPGQLSTWSTLLQQAAATGTFESLTAAVAEQIEHLPEVNVQYAADRFVSGEFNRLYWRGLFVAMTTYLIELMEIGPIEPAIWDSLQYVRAFRGRDREEPREWGALYNPNGIYPNGQTQVFISYFNLPLTDHYTHLFTVTIPDPDNPGQTKEQGFPGNNSGITFYTNALPES